jgi:preprotein translocase subunit SecD
MASAPAKGWHFFGWSVTMRNQNSWLVVIVLLIIFSLWINISKDIVIYNPFTDTAIVERNVDVKLGLDLRGGFKPPRGGCPCGHSHNFGRNANAKNIMENRVNGLGVRDHHANCR